jgi:hypothetical protein
LNRRPIAYEANPENTKNSGFSFGLKGFYGFGEVEQVEYLTVKSA